MGSPSPGEHRPRTSQPASLVEENPPTPALRAPPFPSSSDVSQDKTDSLCRACFSAAPRTRGGTQQARFIHYKSPLGPPVPSKPGALFKTGLNLAQNKGMCVVDRHPRLPCIFPISSEEAQHFPQIRAPGTAPGRQHRLPLPSCQMELALRPS